MKKIWIWIIVGLLIILGLWWASSFQGGGESVLSRNGVHWHPTLAIYIDGEQIDIPANIGLIGGHAPIHTHDESADVREAGVTEDGHKPLHLEIGGVVRESDLRLGNFFDIWNRRFDAECIFDNCIADGESIRMTVNGQENTEYENYSMREGDKIEIFYLSSDSVNSIDLEVDSGL